MPFLQTNLLRWLIVCPLLLTLTACSSESETTAWPKVELKGAEDKVLLKSSYEVLIDGQKAGYMLLDAKSDEKAGEVYGMWFTALKFRRGEDITSTLQDIHFVETPDGVLKSITVDSSAVPSSTKIATVVGETLEYREEQSEEVINGQKPWPAGVLGPLAIDMSLIKKPMQPGETREFSNVEPSSLSPYQQTLTAADFEEVDGQSLLRIDVVSASGDISMEGVLWVNEKGVTVKASYPQMSMEVVLTERTEATVMTSNDSLPTLDLNEVSSVEVLGIYEQDSTSQKYTLRSELTDLTDLFPTTDYQQVSTTSEDEVEIATSDEATESEMSEQEIPESYLAASALVNVEHTGIQAKVQELTKGLESDSEKLSAIHLFVNEHMSQKSYSKAMASAADAYESQEGDCTEHACLLAAMARAVGIPTRMAAGFVAVPDGAAMFLSYHMWNESYINGQWVPSDGTRPVAKPRWSRYIKISDTALSSEDDQQYALKALLLLGDLQVYSK